MAESIWVWCHILPPIEGTLLSSFFASSPYSGIATSFFRDSSHLVPHFNSIFPRQTSECFLQMARGSRNRSSRNAWVFRVRHSVKLVFRESASRGETKEGWVCGKGGLKLKARRLPIKNKGVTCSVNLRPLRLYFCNTHTTTFQMLLDSGWRFNSPVGLTPSFGLEKLNWELLGRLRLTSSDQPSPISLWGDQASFSRLFLSFVLSFSSLTPSRYILDRLWPSIQFQEERVRPTFISISPICTTNLPLPVTVSSKERMFSHSPFYFLLFLLFKSQVQLIAATNPDSLSSGGKIVGRDDKVQVNPKMVKKRIGSSTRRRTSKKEWVSSSQTRSWGVGVEEGEDSISLFLDIYLRRQKESSHITSLSHLSAGSLFIHMNCQSITQTKKKRLSKNIWRI